MATDTNYIKQIELVQDGVGTSIDIGVPHVLSLTYDELKTLKKEDGGNLTPGVWYRITDYVCTVNSSSTGITATSDKKFDILILATSKNTFLEECFAVYNDEPLDNSNLNAWKIWYSFDGDEKYTWISNDNKFKGVIYRMIDENGNDCPYDFKNIKINGKYTFTTTGDADATTISAKNNIIRPCKNADGRYIINKIQIFGTNILSNTFDVDCHDIIIGDVNKTGSVIGNKFDSDVNKLDFSKSSILKHVHVHSGVQNAIFDDNSKFNADYEKYISKDSDSEELYMWYI